MKKILNILALSATVAAMASCNLNLMPNNAIAYNPEQIVEKDPYPLEVSRAYRQPLPSSDERRTEGVQPPGTHQWFFGTACRPVYIRLELSFQDGDNTGRTACPLPAARLTI